MEAPNSTETLIQLDAKHRCLRSGARWAVLRRQTNGAYDLVEAWDGSRRSLLQWCDRNGVYPTREAEAVLATLSEGRGFVER